MTPVERLRAAIDKLETMKQESFDGPWVAHHPFSYSWIEGAPYAGMRSKIAVQVDEPDAELIVTLHRTIDAQLAILRFAVGGLYDLPEFMGLADAILDNKED